MTQLRIADLLATSPVDPAAHLDPERVRHYTERPGDLPPVVVFRTDQGLLLADGRVPSSGVGEDLRVHPAHKLCGRG
jgi:hypothetical protein